MNTGRLSSALAVFEKNIQLNRENGAELSLFGQKRPPNSATRLFAHQKLADETGEASFSSLCSDDIGDGKLNPPSFHNNSFRRDSGKSEDAIVSSACNFKRTTLKPPSIHVPRDDAKKERRTQCLKSSNQKTTLKLPGARRASFGHGPRRRNSDAASVHSEPGRTSLAKHSPKASNQESTGSSTKGKSNERSVSRTSSSRSLPSTKLNRRASPGSNDKPQKPQRTVSCHKLAAKRESLRSASREELLAKIKEANGTPVCRRKKAIGSTGKDMLISSVPFPTSKKTTVRRLKRTGSASSKISSGKASNHPVQKRKSSRAVEYKKEKVVDEAEQQMMEEIKDLEAKVATFEQQIAQIEICHGHDLAKVNETKDRRLRRAQADQNTESGLKRRKSHDLLLAQQQKSDTVIRNLAVDNAGLRKQNRNMSMHIERAKQLNKMMEDRISENDQFFSQIGAFHEKHVQEHDQLVELVLTYQMSIQELERALDVRGPHVESVQNMTKLYEDRIEMIVEMTKRKCDDAELLDELLRVSLETDTDSDPERSSFRRSSVTSVGANMQDQKIIEAKRSPQSVVDLLMPESAHSIYIFEGTNHS